MIINKKIELEIINSINEKISKLFHKYLENNEDDKTFIGTTYLRKIDNEKFLNKDEIFFIQYICDKYNTNSKILNFMPGFGELSIALKILGYKDIDICQNNKKRFHLMKEILPKFNLNIPLYDFDYREMDLKKYDLIFTINAKSDLYGVKDYNFIKKIILSK